ncbi:MAG: hypothetical protein WDN04_14800 [Rhodospirillales bacterium]
MRKAALILALAVASGAAWAQPAPDAGPPPGAPPPTMAPAMAPHHMKMKDRFETANTTHDGRLTLDQAQAANWKMVVRHFPDIDHDHKGYVTLQDLKQFRQEMHAAKQGAMPHGQPPAPGAPPPGAPPPGGQPPAPGAPPPGSQPY